MVKKILSLITFIGAGSLVAQNLDLQDENDVSIDGLTHYVYDDTGFGLSGGKFHVANNSSSSIVFDAIVSKVENPTGDDLQVCFGQLCFVALDNVSTDQPFSDVTASAPASGSYNEYKVAPFSFGWSTGDWTVWKVRVVNTMDASDQSEAYVVWTIGGSFAGDQNDNKIVDGSEVAGDVDGDGVINGSEITGDMNGNGVIDVWEVNGDANGNGIIDNGEVVSVSELNKDNVVFDIYPNPVSNQLTIRYKLDESINSAAVEVYDLLGQKVAAHSITNNKGQLNIDVNELDSGVYFYMIKSGEETIKTQRVIVQ